MFVFEEKKIYPDFPWESFFLHSNSILFGCGGMTFASGGPDGVQYLTLHPTMNSKSDWVEHVHEAERENSGAAADTI